MQGNLDEGLPLLDGSIAKYVELRLHTNRATWMGARAEGLARAGRIEEARPSLAAAQQALVTDGEAYAEPIVLAAEGAVLAAEGDTSGATETLRRASARAIANGGHGMNRRIVATAAAVGVSL